MGFLKDWINTRQEKLEREKLHSEIHEKYGKDVQGYSIEKMRELLELLNAQREFLQKYKDVKFESFSYFRPDWDELPAFYYTRTTDYGTRFIQRAFPFSPRTVKLCIKNLNKKERLILSQDIESFEEMYSRIANASKFQEDSWRGALLEIKASLKNEWNKFVSENADKITEEDLARVDWGEFGREIKPYLAPSYDKNPSEVKIYSSKSGKPLVKLKMQSKTTQSYRRILIQGDSVSESINNDCGFVHNQGITNIWNNYYTELLLEHLNEEQNQS